MKQEKEMKYEAPVVEVLEVEVEKGFEGSSNPNNNSGFDPGTIPGD